MIHFKLVLLVLLYFCPTTSTVLAQENLRLNELSEKFLERIQEGKSTEDIRTTLSELSMQELETGLQNDREKLAFWINLYNAYIQHVLREEPGLYEDRSTFFKKEQIPIAGSMISFEKIEHGFIRKSQWPYGLGYIRKWFPGRMERKLRVDARDYRIHFALNCGAKDCPPVAIYTPERLNVQLDKGTETYLKRTTKYNPSGITKVTPLFRWFRGDFSPPGIEGVLKRHGVIPADSNAEIEFSNYDWTLELDNFVKL